MPRLVLLAAFLSSLIPLLAAAQPQDEREAALMEDSIRARNLATAVHIYHQERQSLPPDLAALAPYLGGTDDEVAARLVSSLADPPDRRGDLGAWLNEHASFRYLGNADAPMDEITDWDRTVIGHLRLDLAHVGPAGPGLPVAFFDGHVEVLPPEQAAALIEESRQLFTALATGGPLPDHRQAAWNLRRLSEALAAWTAAHDGLLPPELAVLLEYIPGGKGASTTQEKARVFLAPKAARNTAIPEQPTADWIRQHCAWEYLAAVEAGNPAQAAAPLALIEDPGATILIHARLADTLERPGDPRRLLAIATASGAVDNVERELAAWRIEQSRKVVAFARSRGEAPLPDLQHAMRDLRLLGRALREYTRLSGGQLPARLSDLYDLVEDPALPLSPRQKAALFLTPRTERGLAILEDDVRPWLAERGNYTLVKSAGEGDLGSHSAPILLHQPLDQPLNSRTEGGEQQVIVVLDASGNVFMLPAEIASDWISGRQ